MVILHLMPATEWQTWAGQGSYAPASLAAEGFVHASPDDDVMLAVANRFYADAPGDWVVVTLDVDALTSEVRWEDPAHPDGSAEPAGGGPRFPHVYGPLDGPAAVGVRRLVRSPDGSFAGYANA